MKQKQFPDNFYSFEEYETYCRCLNKINIGDIITICVISSGPPNRFVPSPKISDITRDVFVIGRLKQTVPDIPFIGRFSGSPILGSTDPNIGFYIKSSYYKILSPNHKLEALPYMFVAYPYDVRIVKITKPIEVL